MVQAYNFFLHLHLHVIKTTNANEWIEKMKKKVKRMKQETCKNEG